MASYTTVRDVLLREFVGANEGDAVQSATELLLEERADNLVVLQGSTPVGLVGVRDLLQKHVDGDATNTTISDVMETEFETIEPEVSVMTALDRFVGSSDPLLVVENDDIIGLVTGDDLLTGSYDDLFDRMPSNADSYDEYDEYDEYEEFEESGSYEDSAEQGICEGCGAFTETLAVTDGQLFCEDCRDI